MRLRKRIIAMFTAMMMASTMAFSVSAQEMTYTDNTGYYHMKATNVDDGPNMKATTKSYNYTGGTRAVGAGVYHRKTPTGTNITGTYETGIISNGSYKSKSSSCAKYRLPYYSYHISEWYNSSVYESGIAFSHDLTIHAVF